MKIKKIKKKKTNLCPICVATHSQLGILPITLYHLHIYYGHEQLYQDGNVIRYVFRDLMAWKQLLTLISLNVAGIKPFSNASAPLKVSHLPISFKRIFYIISSLVL